MPRTIEQVLTDESLKDPVACLALADIREEHGCPTLALDLRRRAFCLTELPKFYDGNGCVDPERLFKQYGRFMQGKKVGGIWEKEFSVEVDGRTRTGRFWWGFDRPRRLQLELTTTPGNSMGDWWWEQRRGWTIPSAAKGIPSDLVKTILERLAEQLVGMAAEEAIK